MVVQVWLPGCEAKYDIFFFYTFCSKNSLTTWYPKLCSSFLCSSVISKVISSIEPSIVVPMHYSTADSSLKDDLAKLDKFLDEMGVEDSYKKEDKIKINQKSDLPEDTDVVVLTPQH